MVEINSLRRTSGVLTMDLRPKKLKKAVVLAGGDSTRLGPLTKYSPVYMFPIFNKPIVEYTLEFLKESGIKEAIYTLSDKIDPSDVELIVKYAKSIDMKVRFHIDSDMKGTAGALKAVNGFIGDEDFLVINCSTFPGNFKLDDALEFHRKNSSAITMVVRKSKSFSTQGVIAGKNGRIKKFLNVHSLGGKKLSHVPTGIYIFNSKALRYIKTDGYMDIKEQLIPSLMKESLPVKVYMTDEYCKPINCFDDYYRVHKELLHNGKSFFKNMNRISDRVWVGDNVSISDQTEISGPVVIGSNSNIKKNARIIGPAVIGNGSIIGENAFFRDSIAWEGLGMGSGASMDSCLAALDIKIPPKKSFGNEVVVESLSETEDRLMFSNNNYRRASSADGSRADAFFFKVYEAVKRFTDIALSATALAVFSPFLLIIAAAIKMDSKGPVLFRQKRRGKNGKLFRMLKFRTMINNAEKLKKELLHLSEVDGPMFKISNDPRITRIGRLLRKASMDELPQLLNVIKGEMSLVGPRPLLMKEMKFSPSWRDLRLKVKPGITGLWQVTGRSDSPFHKWISYDTFYVRNRSFLLDLKILLKTVPAVFKRSGSY